MVKRGKYFDDLDTYLIKNLVFVIHSKVDSVVK